MEKQTPHCPLVRVRQLLAEKKVRTTLSAVSGAAALGLSFADMMEVIRTLTARDFYKSMTTYADHRLWQDVYHATTVAGAVYIKLTVTDDLLIVSFKEL